MTADRNNEIDEALKRIHAAHKQVAGVLIVNADGAIIKSTLRPQSSASTPSAPTALNGFGDAATGGAADDPGRGWADMVSGVVERARTAFKENEELQFIKIRTRKHEFMVVPERDLMLLTILNSESDSL